MALVDDWRYHAEVMIWVPDDPRGPRAARPHQLYEPGVPPDGARAAGERVPEARGGTAAAFGFVLALAALAGLWFDRAVVHSGAEAAIAAAAVAAAGIAASAFGLRAARADGRSARGAMACIGLSVAVLVLALAPLVRT